VIQVLTALRDKPHPASFIGSGKTEELKQLVEAEHATLVVVNHAISPIQERKLEQALDCRVLDRTGLILDIFAQRASSHEGKLQVELAQLKHLSTRLVRGWTHLERQKGGIGLRGPGETQLETDRRLIGKRIKTLSSRLDKLSKQRHLRRRARGKVPIPVISLLGYTNAGKSTLFNRITGEDIYVADQLFATLDPTMRRLKLDGFGDVVLSDTVGFIEDLPHTLVNAFHSTLEEVANASVLLHVVDKSDENYLSHIDEVNKVIKEIGADDIPLILIYNKVDLCEESAGISDLTPDDQQRYQIQLSAQTGEGVELVNEALTQILAEEHLEYELTMSYDQAKLHSVVHQKFTVLSEQETDQGWSLSVLLDGSQLGWLEKHEAGNYIINQ
jgi:GTP-binding protein HflX